MTRCRTDLTESTYWPKLMQGKLCLAKCRGNALIFGGMGLRVSLILTAFLTGLAACSEPPAEGRSVVTLTRDSIRARQERAFAERPDTAGSRVDSLRIDGQPSAPVWIVITSDFQCDRCRAFARDVLPTLRQELSQTGRARIAFVNFPQDNNFNARFAAHAALCAAGGGHFWSMHDSLFSTRDTWDRLPDPQAWFDSLGARAGASLEAMTQCRDRQTYLPLLFRDIERSRRSGITALPAVFVGAELIPQDKLSAEHIRAAVDAQTPR